MSKTIHLRKISIITFIALFAAILTYVLTACTPANEDNTIKKGTLKAAIEDNNYPWAFVNSDDKVGGFNVVYLNKICKDAGYEVEYVPMDFKDIIKSINSHDTDISFDNIKVTPERQEKVDFSDPYTQEGVSLYIPAKSDQTLDTLREKTKTSKVKIAIQDGTFYEPSSDQLDNAQLVEFTKVNDMINAVKNGEVDAAIDISNSVLYTAVVSCNSYPLLNGEKRDVAIAINKNIKNVKEKLNNAIAKETQNAYADKVFKYYKSLPDPLKWDGTVPEDL